MTAVRNRMMVRRLVEREEVRDKYVNQATNDCGTPLGIAARNGDLTTVRMLLGAGADLEPAPVQDDPLPLHVLFYAISSPTPSLDVIEMLIHAVKRAGGDVSPMSSLVGTPLHCASSRGKVEILDLLVKAGADVWARDNHGSMPIHRALSCRQSDVALWLLQRMMRYIPEDETNWNVELLHHAIRRRSDNLDLFRLLVKNGADVFAKDADGKTALQLTLEWGKPQNYKRETWPAQDEQDAQEVAGILLQADPYLWPSGHINRQLWELMQEGWVEEYDLILLNLLVETGKSALEINRDTGHCGYTALHYLCDSIRSTRSEDQPKLAEERNLRLVTLLLESGASPIALSQFDESPLFLATRRNRTEVVRLLLKHDKEGQMVNQRTTTGASLPILGVPRSGAT
jgi:ankyrin repeat protein